MGGLDDDIPVVQEAYGHRVVVVVVVVGFGVRSGLGSSSSLASEGMSTLCQRPRRPCVRRLRLFGGVGLMPNVMRGHCGGGTSLKASLRYVCTVRDRVAGWSRAKKR